MRWSRTGRDGTVVSWDGSSAPTTPGRGTSCTAGDGSGSTESHLTRVCRSTAPRGSSDLGWSPPCSWLAGEGTDVKFERGATASTDAKMTTWWERRTEEGVALAVDGEGVTNPEGVRRGCGSGGAAASPLALASSPLSSGINEPLGKSGAESAAILSGGLRAGARSGGGCVRALLLIQVRQ